MVVIDSLAGGQVARGSTAVSLGRSAELRVAHWAERTTWTPHDQEDFHAHLKRARRDNRAGYLTRQARALAGSTWPDGTSVALQLLRAAEAAGVNDLHRSGYHQLMAQCLFREGQVADGLAEYHKAFAAQRSMPNIRLGLQIDFAWRVAVGRLTECYADALAYLGEFTDTMDLAWPVNQYKYFGSLAIISDALGDSAGARRWARNALEAASRPESSFPGHPELGLVTRPESGAYNELLRLAAA